MSAGKTGQNSPKKRRLCPVNGHLEVDFSAEWPSEVVSRQPDRPLSATVLRLVACLLLAGWIGAATQVHSADTSAAAGNETERVHIIADQLVAESAERSAEFTGNVRAVQDTTVITADRLKIFYKAGPPPGSENGPEGETGAMEKIHCSGHVVIHFDDKVAVSQDAIYTADDGILILTGAGTTLTSEKNSVVGEKITVFRNEDRMLVQGGSQQRVEAVFFSKGKGLK
ncbi:MAG: hypothetical protein JEZ11_20375 [Desulfobacterales bacterium]|nr:hypothetical protein [Desulfobacterales bacterium]